MLLAIRAVPAAHHVHPVQGVQVVEVDDVVLNELHAVDQVPDQIRVGRDGDVQGILHGAAGGHGVHDGTNAADPLGKGPGVARVAPLHDDLDPAELGRMGPGVGDTTALRLRLDPCAPLHLRNVECPMHQVGDVWPVFRAHGRTNCLGTCALPTA